MTRDSRAIADMRNDLAHEKWRADPQTIQATVDDDLGPLRDDVERLLQLP